MELERNKAGKLKVSRCAFTVEYKAEVVRHKKAELSRAKMELSIVKKAAAYFARESM